jgi:hypothetical protein
MKYEIRADCKSYSEWTVDESGRLLYCEHDFEGTDIINYKIVDENLDSVFEDESFEVCKKELAKLNKK